MSSSQSHEELERFCSSLDSLLSNINDQHPACSIVIGDFNAKCSKWCTSDKDNTAGLEIDSITTTAGYSQMINKPTHFINESLSCIDLIYSSNTSFVKNCGSELSIYEKCHHNIIYGTLNFDIPHPLPHYRDVWDYKHANTESIQKAISPFDWSKAFLHQNAKEKCKILTDVLLNVFKNHIPHKTQKFDYKTPDWINKSIILSLKKRSRLTKRYYANPTNYNKEMLLHQVSECTKLTVEAKDKHLAKLSSKLDNRDTAPKTYWSITNRFLNNKKVPSIPAALFEGKLISDFEKKAELFKNDFPLQCFWSKMQVPYQTLSIKPIND